MMIRNKNKLKTRWMYTSKIGRKGIRCFLCGSGPKRRETIFLSRYGKVKKIMHTEWGTRRVCEIWISGMMLVCTRQLTVDDKLMALTHSTLFVLKRSVPSDVFPVLSSIRAIYNTTKKKKTREKIFMQRWFVHFNLEWIRWVVGCCKLI